MSEGRKRYWRATLDGETLEAEGLEPALVAIFQKWGGPSRASQGVRQALTIGGSTCLILTEAGRVLLSRDDELGKTRAAAETQDVADGRVREFYGEFVLSTYDKDGGAIIARENLMGEGLMGLIEQCARRTQSLTGGIPACMSRANCQARERTWRVQISRGKGTTVINFPSLTDEREYDVEGVKVFGVNNKSYFAMLHLRPDAPAEKPKLKLERLAFGRKGNYGKPPNTPE